MSTSRPTPTLAPLGCFCAILDAPSACLTCTCPDCGAAGRFGSLGPVADHRCAKV